MEAGISRSKPVVIGDAGHLMYREKPADDVSGKARRIQPSGDRFSSDRIASEVDEAILLRGFWVVQRFSAALADSLGLGLRPLKFYQRQHAEG